MATIGGLTNSTSNSIRGYGGLASGLDRDTLIEGMTYGTTSKITKQQQKKQQLEWKQTAIQSITNLMVSFANKYTSSWSSSTNLFSDAFWGRNNISTTGTNSKFVSVSGTASSAEGVSIMGVKQLAQKAKWSSSSSVSDQTLSTGEIDTSENYDIYNLIGTDIDFKISNGSDGTPDYFTLSLDYFVKDNDGKDTDKKWDYSTAAAAKKSINDQLAQIDAKTGKLSDYVEAYVDTASGKIGFKQKNDGTNSTSVTITGGSALSYLGFEGEDISLDETGVIGKKDMDLVERVDFDKKIAGKNLTFTYNGTTKSITMPGINDLNGLNQEDKIKKIASTMQEQLDSAFGKGRIRVETSSNGISFKTMDAAKYNKLSEEDRKDPAKIAEAMDKTSTLTLSGGDEDVKEALKLSTGMSNRLDMNKTLLAAGSSDVKFKINGEEITITEKDTMASLMAKINGSSANVTMSYQTVADKLTITSNENGGRGSFVITADDQAGKDFINKIFGTKKSDGSYDSIKGEGQDAIVAVKYAGSDEAVELIRDTNSFTVDGLTINVKGEFGYDGTGADKVLSKDPDKVVEIDAQVDADKIVDGVKSMIEEYNAIIELVNKELTTKPDREYEPLTSEQKKELSEDEVKLYEEKAKQGMLFGDSDLRGLSSDLRFIIGGGIAQELANMGITTSSTYSDNGKLSFDESKFRAALASDPERVQELFTSSSIQNPNGNGTTAGIAANLKNVMSKYVETMGSWESKGILIKKAGHESSPVSVTENYMYKQLAEINKQITKLQTLLKSERDRYVKQFTSLETLISQMNSQSSYLSQIGGY